MNIRLFRLVAVLASNVVAGAQSSSAGAAARQWRQLHQAEILEQFTNLATAN